MKSELGLSIVVPLYRSEGCVARLFTELSGVKVKEGYEVVLVNDGSPDSTREVVQKLMLETKMKVVFVDLSRNYGEHNAVMAGLKQTSGSYVVIMDDDLQNPVAEALRLYDHACEQNFDAVYSRYKTKEHHWIRNWGSYFTNYLFDLIVTKPKGLYLSSFKCINRMVVNAICEYDGPYPYVDGLLLQFTTNIGVLDVKHDVRFAGESSYTLKKLIRLFLITFTNFSIIPLRVATYLGLLTGLFGFICVFFVFYEVFVLGLKVEGWASLMAVILVFSSVQFLSLGIIGEYMGRVFMTINKSPQFLVRSIQKTK